MLRNCTILWTSALLLVASLPSGARVRPDWSNVQSLRADTKVVVLTYREDMLEKRRYKGKFISATSDNITLLDKSGNDHTIEKDNVQKVLVRRPILERWPGWIALAIPFAVVEAVFVAGGDYDRPYAHLILAAPAAAVSAVSFFFGSRYACIYNVPPAHRLTRQSSSRTLTQ